MYSENDLLRPAEVSKLVGFSEKALANRRNRRLDPPWFRPPGSNRILYRRGDVIAWINAGRRDPMGGRQDG